MTINAKINVTTTTTKALTSASISSADRRSLRLLSNRSRGSFNFLLQDWGYKIIRAGLVKLTSRLLALSRAEVIRVLTIIPVGIATS